MPQSSDACCFVKSGPLLPILEATRLYRSHGKPAILYSDKPAYSGVNNKHATTGLVRQFARAMRCLNITHYARDQSGKGRVEHCPHPDT